MLMFDQLTFPVEVILVEEILVVCMGWGFVQVGARACLSGLSNEKQVFSSNQEGTSGRLC